MSEDKKRKKIEKQMTPGRRAARRRQTRTLRKQEKQQKKKHVLPFLIKIIIAAAAAFMLVYYAGFRVTVNGDSMRNTLANGESVLVNRLIYKVSVPKENDIIVFSLSGNIYDRTSYSVKRVVGEPGDVVAVKEGKLYVNGKAYSAGKGNSVDEAGMGENGVTVGDNEYFVLGDDPASSEDSRFSNIGCIPKSSIVGKVWLRIFPRSAFGRVK